MLPSQLSTGVKSLNELAKLDDKELIKRGFPRKHWSVLRAGVTLLMMESRGDQPQPLDAADGTHPLVQDDVGEAEDIKVQVAEAHMRLDALLARRFPAQSRTYFGSLCSCGCVLVDGKPAAKSARLPPGKPVSVYFKATADLDVRPEPVDLDVLWEDDDILLVNKAAGMVVHPAPGNWQGTMANGVLHRLLHDGGADDVLIHAKDGGRLGVVVHRLDKGTSGCIVFAKSAEAQRRLSDLFRRREVHKSYLAIAAGDPGAGQLDIDLPIGRHPTNRLRMAVVDERDGGREAHSRVTKLAYNGQLSLCRVVITTGRTHQIRVHMRQSGLPIVGDGDYGSRQWNAVAQRQLQVRRPLLHAERLAFTHPFTGTHVEVVAPVPDDMGRAISWIRSTPGADVQGA